MPALHINAIRRTSGWMQPKAAAGPLFFCYKKFKRPADRKIAPGTNATPAAGVLVLACRAPAGQISD